MDNEEMIKYINIKEIKKEHSILMRRIIYRRAMKKEIFTVSNIGSKVGNSAFVIKIEFSEYNSEEAQKLSMLLVQFVKGLRFVASKAYGGKYQGVTYYIKPNWEWWLGQGKEKDQLETTGKMKELSEGMRK